LFTVLADGAASAIMQTWPKVSIAACWRIRGHPVFLGGNALTWFTGCALGAPCELGERHLQLPIVKSRTAGSG
jgi:hypothetical protein